MRIQGTIVRRGRTLAFLRAEARVEGAVVATAQVTKTLVVANIDAPSSDGQTARSRPVT